MKVSVIPAHPNTESFNAADEMGKESKRLLPHIGERLKPAESSMKNIPAASKT
jgi:hypothetical protein